MITKVSVHNYKSLADVEVQLGSVTVLVGQNGTGKSNFIEALEFLHDALSAGSDLDTEIMELGGITSIRRHSPKGGRPYDITISIAFLLEDMKGHYSFAIAPKSGGDFFVRFEKFSLGEYGFEASKGKVTVTSTGAGFELSESRPRHLMLPVMASWDQVDEDSVYYEAMKFLRDARHYNILPNSLRDPEKPTIADRLWNSGINLSSVLRAMKQGRGDKFEELVRTLGLAVPSIVGIDVKKVGGFLVVNLKHQFDGLTSTFDLSQESDGTIRLLAILTALYQDEPPRLITLEEPELTVHPGALGILYDVIKEASLQSQIVITTHSPELISLFSPDELRVVEMVDGMTQIGPVNEKQIEVINNQLFSAGDLLRIEGLRRQASF